MEIPTGIVWYFGQEPDEHKARGQWRSEAIARRGSTLYVVFQLDSTTDDQEAGGVRQYEGLMKLTLEDGHMMKGTFWDLGERQGNWGTVSVKKSEESSLKEACQAGYAEFGR